MVAQVIIRFLQEIAMGYVDVSKRVTDEAERVMRKVRQKTEVTFGDMSYEVKGNTCVISVESNFSGRKYGLGDDIADIISKSGTTTNTICEKGGCKYLYPLFKAKKAQYAYSILYLRIS